MPRGKNYVNNNRGVRLSAPKKNSTSMIACQYGMGCTRTDCVYRHEGPPVTESDGTTAAVCLPFLAGICTFTDKGCRRRHPTDPQEVERLVAKYKKTSCRFGNECRTEGCLYLHPNERQDIEPNYIHPLQSSTAFPPLMMMNSGIGAGGGGGFAGENNIDNYNHMARKPPAPLLNSAWRPTLPTAMMPPLQHQHRQHRNPLNNNNLRQQQQMTSVMTPMPTPTTNMAVPTWPAPRSTIPVAPPASAALPVEGTDPLTTTTTTTTTTTKNATTSGGAVTSSSSSTNTATAAAATTKPTTTTTSWSAIARSAPKEQVPPPSSSAENKIKSATNTATAAAVIPPTPTPAAAPAHAPAVLNSSSNPNAAIGGGSFNVHAKEFVPTWST